jgi:uncharacterized protein
MPLAMAGAGHVGLDDAVDDVGNGAVGAKGRATGVTGGAGGAVVVARVPLAALGGRRVAPRALAAPLETGFATPRHAHAFASPNGEHLLVVNGSRLYDVPAGTGERLRRSAHDEGPDGERRLLAALGLDAPDYITPEVEPPPVNALSLALTEHCNLGCGYCYAEGGSFGAARAQAMPWPVARAAIDRLHEAAGPGATVRIAFMGGEPLLARALMRRAVAHATAQAERRGQQLRFAITSNGTQLRDDDVALFVEHGFAVTISLDGPAALHDQLRPLRGGGGSHARILARLPALLRRQGEASTVAGRPPMQASARLTVTPAHLQAEGGLRAAVESLMALGFHSVGVAPSLTAAHGAQALEAAAVQQLLEQMKQLADTWAESTLAGRHYPFSNALAAMRELHRGTHRPFACGAGAAYLGVAADGAVSACHRFQDDERAAMGHVLQGGFDDSARARWLRERHVDTQQPCQSCWARYLCGGGCHHEVLNRGRVACDFIRGWLEHVLRLYLRLSSERPALFGS